MYEEILLKGAALIVPNVAPFTLTPIGRAAAEDEAKGKGAGRIKCGYESGQVKNSWDQDCTEELLQLGMNLDALTMLTSPENWRDLTRSGRNVFTRGEKKFKATPRPPLPGHSSFGPSRQGTAAAACIKRGRPTRADRIAKVTKPSLRCRPAPGK
jgi:hypothetical protein